jgi:stage II sporulation protein AA (anti-sigma F factor antagonist)
LAASADGFRIESNVDHVVAWRDLAGEGDAATAPLLDAKITEAAASGVEEVVLRCAGLEFIDSSGLSVIVANHKRLRDGGRRLVIESAPVAARRLFEIAGLERVLNLREGPGAE